MPDIPIILHHTTTDTNTPSLLYAGEVAVATGPTRTKLWIGDGITNRLLLSTDVADNPLITQATLGGPFLSLTGGTLAGPGNLTVSGALTLGTPLAVASGGIPAGGAINFYLAKTTAADRAVEWRALGALGTTNTSAGSSALSSTTGLQNSAFGQGALFNQTFANFNTAIGASALVNNLTKDANTAVGANALASDSANQNGFENVTALGYNAGFNAAVGRLYRATSSVFIGVAVSSSANDQTNEIVIGANAVGNGSDTITLGNTDVTALYTRAGLVLGNNPTGGALGQGTVNITGDYYVNGVKLGVEPTVDGAYLRVKNGSNYSWQNDIYRLNAGPILTLTAAGGAQVLALNGYSQDNAAVVINSDGGAILRLNEWDSEKFGSTGMWINVQDDGVGLYVDNCGRCSGIVVESGDDSTQGIDVIRYPGTGSNIRLTHGPVTGSSSAPPDYLIGNISFAGVTGRRTPDDPVWSQGFETWIADSLHRAPGAVVQAVTTEHWRHGTAYGSRLEFWTTPNGTTTPQKAFVVDHNGGINILRDGVLVNLLDWLDSRYVRFFKEPAPGPFSVVHNIESVIFRASGPSEIQSIHVTVISTAADVYNANNNVEFFRGPISDLNIWAQWPAAWISVGQVSTNATGDFVMTLTDHHLDQGECLYLYTSGVASICYVVLTLVSGAGTGPTEPRP